jgi:hypothetical protein
MSLSNARVTPEGTEKVGETLRLLPAVYHGEERMEEREAKK